MDNNGKTVNNVLNANDGRMNDLIFLFKQNGSDQIYSDNNVNYGVLWAPGHKFVRIFERQIHAGWYSFFVGRGAETS